MPFHTAAERAKNKKKKGKKKGKGKLPDSFLKNIKGKKK